MKIVPEQDWRDQWCAHDSDTYDGAEDSTNRHQVGTGKTEAAAVADLEILAWDEEEDHHREHIAEMDRKWHWMRRA